MTTLTADGRTAITLSRSADLIAADGLHVDGGYWPTSQWQRYRRGMPTDAVGAIAVTLGHTAHIAVEHEVVPPVLGDLARDQRCDPAVIALMGHLRRDLSGLFAWSDTAGCEAVVAAMRECAAKVATVPVCLCCGVELGQPNQAWCEFAVDGQAAGGVGVSVNVELLRKVLEHVTAHPDEHNQHAWAVRSECGTAYCLAGHAVLMAGIEIDWSSRAAWTSTTGEVQTAAVENGGSIGEAAADLLNIEASAAIHDFGGLFFASNTLADLWRIAGELTDGAIVPPAGVTS